MMDMISERFSFCVLNNGDLFCIIKTITDKV